MFTVGVSGTFQANHYLTGDVPEQELSPHSHPYELRWEISVATLDAQGFGINIAHMEEVRDKVLEGVSTKLLNDLPFFQGIQTSIENLGKFLLENLDRELELLGYESKDWLWSRATIYENAHAWASYQRTQEQL